ncbi:MAG: hypothetical protein ACK4TA_07790 [Saprospiraceae bacterium]
MATRDYIPRTDAELITWLTNFKLKLPEIATRLNLPMDRIYTLIYKIDGYIQSIHTATTKKEEYSKAVADKNDQGKVTLKAIRAEANLMKALEGYTEGIGQELGIIGTTRVVDMIHYKPSIKLDVFARGIIRIAFVKGDTDGVNIYRRRKGSLTWEFVARDTVSPYEDRIQLQNPGQPEHWEYCAIAVIKDQEIGQPSDVVEVVIGG